MMFHPRLTRDRCAPGWALACTLFLCSALATAGARAAEPPVQAPAASRAPAMAVTGEPEGLTRLARDYDLWLDAKRKLVVVDGRVCLREGFLEMFACPEGTKEHESVVSVNSKASFVHAALLAIGAKPGHPVRFLPDYVPAAGTVVDVFVYWKDAEGKEHNLPAQQWVKHTKTGKPMQYSWVFAGSGFAVDEATGERFYYADSGDLICVSNFPSAMLDLPVPSSQDNSGLLFQALTENIPPLGTPVRLVLVPRLEQQAEVQEVLPANSSAAGGPADTSQ